MNYFAFSALVNGITSILLGIFVLVKGIKSSLNRGYAFFAFSVFFWSFGYFFWQLSKNPGDALFWSRFFMAGAILIPVGYFNFSLQLTNKYPGKKTESFLSYIICLIFLGMNSTPIIVSGISKKLYFEFWPNPGSLYPAFLLMFFYYVAYSLYLMFKSYKFASGRLKEQIKYVFLGTGIGFICGSTNYLLWYNIPVPPVLNIFVTVYTALIAYAILRHRLMDIEFVIKRSFVYSILTALIIGVYTLIIFVSQELFANLFGLRWLLILIGSALIAIGFKPLETAFTIFTDKFFFKKKYDYHKTLAELAKGMAELTNLERLTKLVARIVVRNMKLEGSMLFVYDYRNNTFNAVSAQGNMKEFKGMTLPKDDPLIKRLDHADDVIIREELARELENKQLMSSFRDEIKDIIKQMTNFKAVLCVPSKIKDKVIGFILLSDKKSQDMYSTEDLMLFQTLAPQAAIAIKNAMTYDEIRKDLEAHQRKLNETEINLSRSERIASMARLIQEYNHEIRTPLAIMSAKLMSLPDDPGDVADFREIKDFFGKQINRASDIVDTTLRLSQPKERKEEPIDLNNVIEDALKLYQPLGVNLIKEFRLLPGIKGDHDDLKLVFINLLKNAREAIPEKGEIKISTDTGENNGEKFVIAKVTDNGIGIPKENMEKIFEPFFSTHTTKGRGLGLSLVFRIVREHHGKIEVESPAEGGGKGSTFSVRIPVG
jgi:signal transduction histidine kinase